MHVRVLFREPLKYVKGRSEDLGSNTNPGKRHMPWSKSVNLAECHLLLLHLLSHPSHVSVELSTMRPEIQAGQLQGHQEAPKASEHQTGNVMAMCCTLSYFPLWLWEDCPSGLWGHPESQLSSSSSSTGCCRRARVLGKYHTKEFQDFKN